MVFDSCGKCPKSVNFTDQFWCSVSRRLFKEIKGINKSCKLHDYQYSNDNIIETL